MKRKDTADNVSHVSLILLSSLKLSLSLPIATPISPSPFDSLVPPLPLHFSFLASFPLVFYFPSLLQASNLLTSCHTERFCSLSLRPREKRGGEITAWWPMRSHTFPSFLPPRFESIANLICSYLGMQKFSYRRYCILTF